MVRKLKKSNDASNSQGDIIKRAQVMQQEMLKVQEGLKDKIVETTVAGGNITVKANGQKDIVDIQISMDILKDAVEDNDTAELSSLVLSAVNDAMAKAEELAEKEMEVVTGGLSIPGLF